VANMGDRREEYRVLVRRPDRRRPPGRSGLRLEDNIEMDIQEVG